MAYSTLNIILVRFGQFYITNETILLYIDTHSLNVLHKLLLCIVNYETEVQIGLPLVSNKIYIYLEMHGCGINYSKGF